MSAVNQNSSKGAVTMAEPDGVNVKIESGVAQVSSTTKFIDDATMAVRDESMISHIDNTILSLSDTQESPQNVIDFLMKPIIIQQGNLDILDNTPPSILFNRSMPHYAFISAAQRDVWTTKLRGYFGMRMDMRFRLVVNANRMQQGRYCLGWVPHCGAYNTSGDFKNGLMTDMHTATLVQRTTIPHVEIDVGTGTSAELLIPFQSVHSFYPLNTILSAANNSTLGNLLLYAYSPLLVNTGPSTCGYTVYMSFENIRLFGAASPQSGISDAEVSNKTQGPISGIFNSFAKGFNEFENIPLLSGYAKKIGWISDRISKSATMFGFSKPTAGDSIAKMQMMNCPAHKTVDGDSDARSLAYLSKPGTVNLDGISGTQYDEMDFSYIVRKYAFFKQHDWTTGQTAGTNLSITSINSDVGYIIAGGVPHCTPLCFVGSFFKYWRGSIKIKIKFVKTEFHSGRIQICFFPYDETSFTGSSAYVNRMIVDIRETTEVEITVPYISRNPWCKKADSVGSLYVDVVDPLVAPSNVPASITCLYEIAGGEDIEFAVPGDFDSTPTHITPQSGCEDDKCILKATIGNSVVSSNPNIFAPATIGDKVTNFRAYLKRFHPVRYNSNILASPVMFNQANIVMAPDAIYGTVNVPPTYYIHGDLISAVVSCYGMWRGGVRFRDVIDMGLMASGTAMSEPLRGSAVTSTVPLGLGNITPFYGNNILSGANATVFNANFHENNQSLTTNNVITAEMPQYTKTYARAVTEIFVFQGTTPPAGLYQGGNSNSPDALSIWLPSNATITRVKGYSLHNVSRALADDGNFSVFISVPPLRKNVYPTDSFYQGYY